MTYSGNVELDKKIGEWLSWDQNEKTSAEIRAYVETANFNELSKILLNRISFGTAGLRGKMASGYTCMNDLVVVQTAQGLLKYLEGSDQLELLRKNGIVIGYDGRYNSKRFAELSAAIFLHKGYLVRLFSTVNPTPFVPFAVSKWKCAAGIMVTASHNPKQDNGYKVYGYNGSQITSPVDKKIQQSILQNLEPWPSSWDTSTISTSDKNVDPLAETESTYIDIVSGDILDEHKAINAKTALKFTYSAMHGVGYNYVVKLMNAVNLQLIPVEEQKDPDPEFSTVKFPNPEEGKSSLDLSFKTANLNDSTIILANDPDADRLAVAEKNLSTGKWRVFNGNELGALLGWWCLHCYQSRYPNESLSDCYVMSSTVSSKILRAIANAEGANFIETLTGFKWMGNKSYELLNENKKIIFAFEEAIGFMCGSTVLDKDGVSAAAVLGTMAAYLRHHSLTLSQQLEEIYNEYGYHVSNNSYFICHEPSVIKSLFERLRNFDGPNTYPKGLLNNKYPISSVRDLTTGFDSSQPDNKAILPSSKSNQMITFNFGNGLVATIRTSGTEPKIKYYMEMCASALEKDRKVIQNTLKEMTDALIIELLQPNQNGLIAKSD
ncbi:hypothetical protein PPYR_05012 [Photinus pyralis]|uniref:Phosphoglucomutase-2 n=2 Tax=Photinus pyralis TaxID=7054 RepID=A0A1Y1N3L1_PHOPY|nr:phosphoglucomutase-2 isoform X2 [Photinus pyralis]XP_031335017.1 phosphoglucomutase-2 isoform X2 [Photinus pyralis]XP_031335018.1 phosphoglucomutase-2 isoform X2 [Photinus pyralis]XP_031335019.1 phosphoglucomutase-2 isoform X2 [Photinus pyralis]XP_031335020.1 phosphoglucomutase-2 isoform X2 [Photinus pyralis]XP_031335022.1 phosphoglucomutase-2 isoform X2 [Photinus pyralis]KAB0802826.1 hypothetical protein PPYR_05012 [Photinus pyralis]